MSDVSQGPGWWQASDGKWYAPQSGSAPVSPPPKARRSKLVPILACCAIAIIAIVIAAAAGGSKKNNDSATATTQAPTTASAAPTTQPVTVPPTTEAPTTAPVKAHVGSTISLSDGNGGKYSVTLVKVIAPETSAQPQVDQVETAGDVWVAVQIRITNAGSSPLAPTPDIGSTIVDSNGQSYNSTIMYPANCPTFADSVSIAPGASSLGCVAFEAPGSAKITGFQFEPGSFGGDTGVWSVP